MSVMVFNRSRYPAGRSGTTVIVADHDDRRGRRGTPLDEEDDRQHTDCRERQRTRPWRTSTMTVAMPRISAPAARLRATAPLESANSAPAMGMMRFKVSARSLGFPESPE